MNWQSKSDAPPAGYAYGPNYRPSRANLLWGIRNILAGRPRSLARDALLALRDTPTPPLVRGQDRLPERGPLVVVANHYERPGLWMAWPALVISDLVLLRAGEDVHWIAIQEWESFSLFGIDIPSTLIRRVFERAFRTYGILAMPAPAAPAAARAAAMRTAVQAIRDGRIIGLMPEGTVGPTPELLPAREGAGAFLLLLAAAGATIAPVGLFEEDGRMVINFGEPFPLQVPRDIAKDQRDAWARHYVMQAIKDLVPQTLWGVFRES